MVLVKADDVWSWTAVDRCSYGLSACVGQSAAMDRLYGREAPRSCWVLCDGRDMTKRQNRSVKRGQISAGFSAYHSVCHQYSVHSTLRNISICTILLPVSDDEVEEPLTPYTSSSTH